MSTKSQLPSGSYLRVKLVKHAPVEVVLWVKEVVNVHHNMYRSSWRSRLHRTFNGLFLPGGKKDKHEKEEIDTVIVDRNMDTRKRLSCHVFRLILFWLVDYTRNRKSLARREICRFVILALASLIVCRGPRKHLWVGDLWISRKGTSGTTVPGDRKKATERPRCLLPAALKMRLFGSTHIVKMSY